MKYPVTLGSLVIANLLLLGWLAGGLGQPAEPSSESAPPEASGTSAPTVASKNGLDPSAAAAAPARSEMAHQAGPRSEILFAHVYSPDPKQFAANLRAIHCPEETIKDILTAEVHRWFQPQEQALRPTPADHVPFAWSAKTAEPKLIERRQKAAALARDESALLHDA